MAVLLHALSFKGIRHRGMVPHGLDASEESLKDKSFCLTVHRQSQVFTPTERGLQVVQQPPDSTRCIPNAPSSAVLNSAVSHTLRLDANTFLRAQRECQRSGRVRGFLINRSKYTRKWNSWAKEGTAERLNYAYTIYNVVLWYDWRTNWTDYINLNYGDSFLKKHRHATANWSV